MTSLFSGVKSAEKYKFFGRIRFLLIYLHELFHCVVTQMTVLMQGQQEYMTEAGEKGTAEEFYNFSGNPSLGQHSRILTLHPSVHTEETTGVLLKLRLKYVCNIGIHNDMVFEVQKLYSFL